MKKLIALISEDKRVAELMGKLDELHSHHNNQVVFIKKSIDDMEKKTQTESDAIRAELEKHLREAGRMPADFSPETQELRVDTELGIVYIKDKSSGSAMGLLAHLMGQH